MINRVTLVGRITKELELRKTNNNTSVVKFTLACNRNTKDKGADFPNCIAWKQSDEYLCKYAHKGDLVGVDGRIQTSSYDGQYGKVYVTEVVAETLCILSSKKEATKEEVVNEVSYDSTPDWYEPSNPKLNGETINTDDCPFY